MASELAPAGTPEPQNLGNDPLLYFTRVYLGFLQGLFAQMPAGSYHWTEDIEQTEIVITDQAPYEISKNSWRPGIVTMRGPSQFANLALDQLLSVDSRTGKKTRADLVSTTMAINVIAKVGLECQRLAWNIARLIRQFKTLIQRFGMHKVGDELTVGPETPPGALVANEGDSEAVMVTVHSPFHFKYADSIVPETAPLMAHITKSLNLGLLQPTADQELRELRLKPPTMRGQLLNPEELPEGFSQFIKI